MRTILIALTLAAAATAQTPLPGAGNVALPLDEYNRLVEMAGHPKPVDAPPLPSAIQRAAIKLQVTGDLASGAVDLDGEIFATGPVKVPLVAAMTVFDARRQGSTLPLLLENGSHAAVLNGPADFHVSLDVGLPVAMEPGRASVTIPAPAAGAVTLSLTVPGDHTSITITGGLITSRASNGGKTTIEATLTGGQSATLRWTTRDSAPAATAPAPPKEARFLSDVKSLVTVGESSIAIAALAELTVIQGEPAQFEIAVPAGWEITGATGATLESSDVRDGALVLRTKGSARSHSFLITMERPVSGTKAEIAALSFAGAQRETGEIVIEGEGTMELSAAETGGVKRMDVKEASAYLRGMAHQSVQSAFRYHRQPGATPGLALEWTRFPNTELLAAVAQSAAVTTLVTSEGRSLTEVKLTVRNREQPFLKVELPTGASIVSAEVEGQAVKPVLGADGSRVPLLRAGFRPTGAYTVSFVMTHAGAPFANKGGSELALPKMDVPIALMEWEVFLPERYRVKDFGGNAIAAALLPRSEEPTVMRAVAPDYPIALQPGMVGGHIVDPTGATIPNAHVTVTHVASGMSDYATTGQDGRWAVSMRPGRLRVQVEARGFRSAVRFVDHYEGRPTQVSFQLDVGAVTETIEVNASAQQLPARTPIPNQMSANASSLQQRVAGVLPIAVDVPKTGNSYRFVRPLVVDEETRLTFSYRASPLRR